MAGLWKLRVRGRLLLAYAATMAVAASLLAVAMPAQRFGILAMAAASVAAAWGVMWVAMRHLRASLHRLREATDALGRGRDNVLRMKASRKLRSDQNLSVGGAPAKRIIIDDSDGNQVIIDLMVVSGDILYQAITASPKGGENSPDVQRFLSSFALVAR